MEGQEIYQNDEGGTEGMSCNCGKSWEKYLPWNQVKTKQGKIDPEKEMAKKLKEQSKNEKPVK